MELRDEDKTLPRAAARHRWVEIDEKAYETGQAAVRLRRLQRVGLATPTEAEVALKVAQEWQEYLSKFGRIHGFVS